MSRPARSFFDQACPEPNTGCLLWEGTVVLRGDGSLQGQVSVNNRGIGAHRRAWELTRGKIPDGMHVLHKCDTPMCVNPEHLFIGTHADNMADMRRKARQTRGVDCHSSKLTEEKVRELRSLSLEGVSDAELGRRFGISKVCARKARIGRTWAWVT